MRTIVHPCVIAAFVSLMVFAPSAAGQAETVFSGRPSVKVSEGGIERVPVTLSRNNAENLGCVISRIGDKYYWATRENKLLVRAAGGAFVTFIAVDGSGYIRVIAPGMKGAASLLSATESTFDYVEHLLTGLRSVTYYGSTTTR